MNTEKWLSLVRVCLGFINVMLEKGTEITHDVDENVVIINGVRYEDTRDLDILKRNKMVVKSTTASKKKLETERQADENRFREMIEAKQEEDGVKKDKMEVIKSEDYGVTEIDISHTVNRKVVREIPKATDVMEVEPQVIQSIEEVRNKPKVAKKAKETTKKKVPPRLPELGE